MNFEEWCLSVDAFATRDGYVGSYTTDTDIETWRGFYENDLCPDEAWSEELHAARTFG